MIDEKQMRKNAANLVKLIRDHLGYPVICMADGAIFGNDTFARWSGILGESKVTEIFQSKLSKTFLKSKYHTDKESALSAVFDIPAVKSMTVDELDEAYEKLPWQKVILVNVDCGNLAEEDW